MTIAGKLTVLNGLMPGAWQRISPGAPLIEGLFANVQALCDLRNALPYIIDVVDAAEHVDKEMLHQEWNEMDAERFGLRMAALGISIDRLRKHLSQ